MFYERDRERDKYKKKNYTDKQRSGHRGIGLKHQKKI